MTDLYLQRYLFSNKYLQLNQPGIVPLHGRVPKGHQNVDHTRQPR